MAIRPRTRGADAVYADVWTSMGQEADQTHRRAVAVAALTVYDMCKAVDRGMKITDVRLVQKTGGKSGTFEAE